MRLHRQTLTLNLLQHFCAQKKAFVFMFLFRWYWLKAAEMYARHTQKYSQHIFINFVVVVVVVFLFFNFVVSPLNTQNILAFKTASSALVSSESD